MLLLVLGVILGLLGMHALGLAAPTPATTSEHTPHQVAAGQAGPEHLCPDDDRGPGRPAAHADQMCASAALPASPGIAAPDTVPVTALPHGVADLPVPQLPAMAVYEPVGGRAPPSLADLQLLRI
ncbi:DUF6153 family protein [Streptomyces anulatus]|uniref:DUF6153 family protein n=1 Tax=Streptomyces anulatus TaxID=1892 RepID=UPI00068A74AA|nr:DUF6153 family protein [Streptomyces anulatus]